MPFVKSLNTQNSQEDAMAYRPNIDGLGMALSCDKTTTGAKLISSVPINLVNICGFAVIRVGDTTTPCPECGKPGRVIEGAKEFIRTFMGVQVAVDRCLVQCDCPLGSNRIIAPVNSWLGKGPSPEQVAAEKHAASLAAAAAAQAIEQKRKAEERERNRVFAKSCLRGEGCNDAGTERKPHANFAQMAFLRALPVADPTTNSDAPQHAQTAKKNKSVAPEDIPKPKKRSALYLWWNGHHEEMDYQAAVAVAASATRAEAATTGANLLEIVGGRALTYGTWAVRAGEIASAGAGASVAGLLIGMMPGRLNDGEQDFLDRMRTAQLREAPTRVRFTWEDDANGNPTPHGWHTPPGMDMVRVRKMHWESSQQAYTFTTEEDPRITLIWTPDHSGVNTPANTGNQARPRLPSSVIVDPLPDDTSISATTSPAPGEKSFADYILIFPVSDIPPIYIYLSKHPNDSIWTKTKSSEPVENAYGHWIKHGHEFQDKSFNNSKEYVDATHDFVRTPPTGTLTKVRQNGDVMYYHPATNTFSVKTKDGVPKTMFKPKGGFKYWEKQK
jgi:pyocin large subunit-like protein